MSSDSDPQRLVNVVAFRKENNLLDAVLCNAAQRYENNAWSRCGKSLLRPSFQSFQRFGHWEAIL